MPTYPTLEAVPTVKQYSHTPLIDPVHRVRFMSGTPLTRVLFTDVPIKYGIFYVVMKNTDKLILEAWERDNIEYGGIQFNWTNPKNAKTYLTKLLKPIFYKIHPQSAGDKWQVRFDVATLSEVI